MMTARSIEILKSQGLLTPQNNEIIMQHENSYAFASSLSYLAQAGILTDKSFNFVSKHTQIYFLASALSHLHKAEILTQANFDLVIDKPNADEIARGLAHLQQEGILTDANHALVIEHTKPFELALAISKLGAIEPLTDTMRMSVYSDADPADFASALVSLNQARLLTMENVALVASAQDRNSLPTALFELLKSELLTEENFKLVLIESKRSSLPAALSYLKNAGILTDENHRVVATHADLSSISEAIWMLQEADILTQENFKLMTSAEDSASLSLALSCLSQNEILTPENKATIIDHPCLSILATTIYSLTQAEILTAENFLALTAANHRSLISKEADESVWSRIPEGLLTQGNFERLLTAAEQEDPFSALSLAMHQIIDGDVIDEEEPVINDQQSTHTASVHRSVTESAIKLKTSYDAALDLSTTIKDIMDYLNALEDSPKHQAAKRCVQRISESPHVFTDGSGISTLKLLAISYVAIHDASKCHAKLSDAKALFVDGLYEIQRGYNFNKKGEDNELADAPICSAGTFNKLMEKLHGIHQDVKVEFITHAGASAKFPKLVQYHTINYLETIASPSCIKDYEQVHSLLLSLDHGDNFEEIWANISKSVEDAIWEEFAEAYGYHREDERFKDLLNHAFVVNLPNIDDIKKQLAASDGCRLYSAQMALHSRGLGLFAEPDSDSKPPETKRLRTS